MLNIKLYEKYYIMKSIILPMASSIKISDETKQALDKLLANLMINYDRKFTQQEILDLLIKLGEANMELLLSPMESPSKNVLNKIKKLQKPWRSETDEKVIDEILYGSN